MPAERISIISHAYENNQAKLHVATGDPPRLTARKKHWNVKHDWFRSRLGDEIKVLPMPRANQLGDVFTKALTQEPFEKFRMTFEKFRMKLLGW